jgi:hypothetical protein
MHEMLENDTFEAKKVDFPFVLNGSDSVSPSLRMFSLRNLLHPNSQSEFQRMEDERT